MIEIGVRHRRVYGLSNVMAGKMRSQQHLHGLASTSKRIRVAGRLLKIEEGDEVCSTAAC